MLKVYAKNDIAKEISGIRVIAVADICSVVYQKVTRMSFFEGEVHSLFDSSVNILFREVADNFLLTVVVKDKPMGVGVIRLKNNIPISRIFRNLGIKAQAKADLLNGYIRIKGENNTLLFDYRGANVNDTKAIIECETCGKLIEKNIGILGDFLAENNKNYGISDLVNLFIIRQTGGKRQLVKSKSESGFSKETEFIETRFFDFIQAYAEYMNNGIDEFLQEKFGRIIGYGPGLTPAMDDFLSGFMATFVYGARYAGKSSTEIIKMHKCMIFNNLKKTTLVSSYMLANSAEGYTNEYLNKLLKFLFNEKLNEFGQSYDKFIELMKKQAAIGASSGLDTLYGVYVACIMLESERG